MAQPVRQLALRAPGFQGLNTELSVINGDPEFALVADNVVVDQIGRLVSRKAFADYTNIGNLDDAFIEREVTTNSGFSADSPVAIDDNYFGLFESPEESLFWSDPSSMQIKINEMDAYTEGGFDPSVADLKLTISLTDSSGSSLSNKKIRTKDYPAGEAEDPPSLLGDRVAVIDVYQEGKRLGGWGLVGPWRRTDLDDGVHFYEFMFLGLASTPLGPITVSTSDAQTPLSIVFTPEGMEEWHPSLDLRIVIDSLGIEAVDPAGRGYNEIFKLAYKIVSHIDPHEQHSQRVVMAYRYGDGVTDRPDSRVIPSGLGTQRLFGCRTPELTGTIRYSVSELVDDALSDLFLPPGWGGDRGEALLSAEFANFKDDLFLFAKAQPFLRLGPVDQWEEVGGVWTDGAGDTHLIDGDIAISAYGRLWVSGVGGDYHQIHYSALLDETLWYDESVEPDLENLKFNDGGIIDVREYWPVDSDSIVNIHAHNGYLLVFGRNSILIYANADSGSPAGILNQAGSGIFLEDTISDVGLVRRDAICNIGTDVLFVDDSGLRSLGRVVQEKSSPLQEPSINIRREIQQVIQQEVLADPQQSAIRLSHIPSESLALLLFSDLQVAYVFHLNIPSKTGGLKVTRWTGCFWNDVIEVKDDQEDIVYLGGKATKGLLKYKGYLEGSKEGDPQPYIMRYESMALAMGQSPLQVAIPKSVNFLCSGEYVPGQANALWGFHDTFIDSAEFQIDVSGGSEFNVNYFTDDGTYVDEDGSVLTELAAEYPTGVPYYKGYKINTTGSGELFRVGLEVKVQGGKYGLQEIDINSAIGRLTA